MTLSEYLIKCSEADKYGHIFHLNRAGQLVRFGEHGDTLDDQLAVGEEGTSE